MTFTKLIKVMINDCQTGLHKCGVAICGVLFCNDDDVHDLESCGTRVENSEY